MNRKKNPEIIIISVLRIYSALATTKSMLLAQRQKHRTMENNRDPEINPHSYYYLIFDKVVKIMHNLRNSNIFNKCY